MVSVDRSFVADLKRLDKRLNCQFDNRMERFVVTYDRAVGNPVPVYIVQSESGGFKKPDQRDILVLHEGDLQREGPRDRIRRIARYMEEYREDQRRKASEAIHDRTKDDKIQLSNAFGRLAGAGKGNATFRRIESKPKGATTPEQAAAPA